MEHDVLLERRTNEMLTNQLCQSENVVRTLAKRIHLLEVGLEGLVEPFSVSDSIEVLNFNDPWERFGVVTSCRVGRVNFRFNICYVVLFMLK